MNTDYSYGDFKQNITENFVFLTQNLTNLYEVLIFLVGQKVISEDERENILSHRTDVLRNGDLLQRLLRKGSKVRPAFLTALHQTGNSHLAFQILKDDSIIYNAAWRCPILKSKWWPHEYSLPNAFYIRNYQHQSLALNLKAILSSDVNKTTVITQTVAVSGLGGVGKSTMAKWFASEFEAYYDYIIWIDCGEKNLLKSFSNLARRLLVQDRNELGLEELASGCFNILNKYRCLWIYDNAETYVGNEGIKNVLPVGMRKFEVIITSRNREWGNEGGLGRIPTFLLDVFDENEAFEFMQKHLKKKVNKRKLEKLCQFVGYLPLALQIAVSTLNEEKISLDYYISRINKTCEIITKNFDDYEKSIKKAMEISLHAIKTHEGDSEGISYEIINVFAYITPDDVTIPFFPSVLMKTKFEVDLALKLLQKYSLVTINEQYETVSIHRLLQQVVRHNNENVVKRKTIYKILKCEGFLPYQLIPFCFADEELQNQFQDVKLELIDKMELTELLKERRFVEAVQLSNIIKGKSPTPISTYNHALCLKLNLDTEEAIILFKHIYEDSLRMSKTSPTSSEHQFYHIGIISTPEFLIKEIIAGELFSTLYNDGEIENAAEICMQTETIFKCDEESIIGLLKFLFSIPGKFSRRFMYDGSKSKSNEKFASLMLTTSENTEDTLEIHLNNCFLHENMLLPYMDKIQKLYLSNVKLPSNFFKLISSSHIEKLSFSNMKVDLSDELSMEEVHLKYVETTNWPKAKWKIQKLSIEGSNFTKQTGLKVNELTLTNCIVNMAVLPQSIEKLVMQSCLVIWFHMLPEHCTSCTFIGLRVVDDSGNPVNDLDISSILQQAKLKSLKLDNANELTPKFPNVPPSKLSFQLEYAISIPDLYVNECNIILPLEKGIRLRPICLTFSSVSFTEKDVQTRKPYITLNDFVEFENIEYLKLQGNNILIHLSDEITVKEVLLNSIQVLTWKNSKWNVKKLTLTNVPFCEPAQMKISELVMEGVSVDNKVNVYNLLNLSIQSLCLKDSIVFANNQQGFPETPLTVQKLKVDNIKVQLRDVDALLPILICPTLREIKWHNISWPVPFDLLYSIPLIELKNCIIKKSDNYINSETVALTNVEIIDESNDQDINQSPNEGTSASSSKNELMIKCPDNSSQFCNDDINDDFPISDLGIIVIKNILANQVESLEAEWDDEITLLFGLSGEARGEISKCKGKFGNRIIKTLRLWRNEKGADATFNVLISVFKKGSDKIVEEELIASREDIRTA